MSSLLKQLFLRTCSCLIYSGCCPADQALNCGGCITSCCTGPQDSKPAVAPWGLPLRAPGSSAVSITIPPCASLRSNLSGLELKGTIPAEGWELPPNLEALWLCRNLLHGVLPPQWEGLPDSLAEIRLDGNNLHGGRGRSLRVWSAAMAGSWLALNTLQHSRPSAPPALCVCVLVGGGGGVGGGVGGTACELAGRYSSLLAGGWPDES